jgi:hypothetical protein
MRLSTIAIDASRAVVPAAWSAEWVQQRLIEAYAIERRLPVARRRMVGSAWPPMATEFADIVGRADYREERFQAWEHVPLGVSAQDISHMEQAHDWLMILAPYPVERVCLAQWAAAIAYRRSLRRMLERRRWSRSSFYRYVTAGAQVIALELTRQGQPVV